MSKLTAKVVSVAAVFVGLAVIFAVFVRKFHSLCHSPAESCKDPRVPTPRLLPSRPTGVFRRKDREPVNATGPLRGAWHRGGSKAGRPG